jgi:hypothetical protein
VVLSGLNPDVNGVDVPADVAADLAQELIPVKETTNNKSNPANNVFLIFPLQNI